MFCVNINVNIIARCKRQSLQTPSFHVRVNVIREKEHYRTAQKQERGRSKMESFDEKLIILFENHSCLYDKKHKSYKDNLLKENIWKQIAYEMKSEHRFQLYY